MGWQRRSGAAGLREEINAWAVAEKVIAAAQAPFDIGTLQLRIGASVGVAFNAYGVGA